MASNDRRRGGPTEAPPVRKLTTEECLRRLREGGVGRLAMRTEGAPEIRPVNFVLDDGRLIVRTGEGSVMRAAKAAEAAGFEVDGVDRLEHTGWSVVVTGKLRALATNAELLALPLRPWADGTRDRFVTLSLDRVSGITIPPGRGNR